MSALSSVLIMVFFASAVLFVSCNRSSEEAAPGGIADKNILLGNNTSNKSITLDEPLNLAEGITLPKGTVLSQAEDDPYSLMYQLPKGYKLVGRTSGANNKLGTPVATTFGSVTCSCTSGSGCSPYVASLGGKPTIGCNLGASCSQCTKKVTALLAPLPNSGGGIALPSIKNKSEIEEADIINFNVGISFVTNPEMKAATTSPMDAFLELPEVQAALQQFMTGYQKSNLHQVYGAKTFAELPDNYVIAAMSLYGKLIFVPIDRDLNDLFATKLLNDYVFEKSEAKNGRVAGYSCSCGSGTSGCTLGSKSIVLVGSVTYCNATVCRVCTLSW
jgi:hypothetical protein